MGTRYSTITVSGFNSSPPADDGSQTASNQVKWVTIKQKLNDPLKTAIESINSALVTALDVGSRQISSNDNTVAADHMKTIEIASSVSTAVTVSLGDAATMAAGYIVTVKNSSAINQTVGRVTAGDKIDNATSNVTLAPKESRTFKVANTVSEGYLVTHSFGGAALPAMWINGVVPSAPTNSTVALTVGSARDVSDTTSLVLSSAITKAITGTWVVGSGSAGLDAGAVTNSSWYYVHLIKRSDTGVVDALISLSATAPTMPANYDKKRLVGAARTDSAGTFVAFAARELSGGGLRTMWTTPTIDINLSNTLTTARRTDVVKVPTSFAVDAMIRVTQLDAGATAVTLVYCPDQADIAPTAGHANVASTTGYTAYVDLVVQTDTSGQIASRSALATVDTFTVSTVGFDWARRN